MNPYTPQVIRRNTDFCDERCVTRWAFRCNTWCGNCAAGGARRSPSVPVSETIQHLAKLMDSGAIHFLVVVWSTAASGNCGVSRCSVLSSTAGLVHPPLLLHPVGQIAIIAADLVAPGLGQIEGTVQESMADGLAWARKSSICPAVPEDFRSTSADVVTVLSKAVSHQLSVPLGHVQQTLHPIQAGLPPPQTPASQCSFSSLSTYMPLSYGDKVLLRR